MLLDMLAAIARKDYEDRRRRQAQGIAEAKNSVRADCKPVYRGRAENTGRDASIVKMRDPPFPSARFAACKAKLPAAHRRAELHRCKYLELAKVRRLDQIG